MNKNPNLIYYFNIFIFYFWVIFFLGISIFFLIFYAASKEYLGPLPNSYEIYNNPNNLATKVYDINGKFLGEFSNSNSNVLNYKDLPIHFISALLSKEDIRFQKHSGIDRKSFLRAFLTLGKRGGGSTISQQLAKLIFTGKPAINRLQRVNQKILEWIMAVELEKMYTKKEILTMYCNNFDFLYNSKGVEGAAITYFNKHSSQLKLGESAVIVGMLENPLLYNPKNHPDRAKRQRNLILKQMRKYHFIKVSDTKFQNELNKPIKINFKSTRNNSNILSTYYSEFLKKEINTFLDEYEKQTGVKINLYTSGLRIYTSIDKKMQINAEKSVKKHLKKLQDIFNKSKVKNKNKNFPFINLSTKKSNRIIIAAIYRSPFYKELRKKGFSNKQIIENFRKPRKITIFTWDGDQKVLMSIFDLIRYQKSIIQSGLISVESSTGYIKAWVGGINYNHFQYDHVEKTKRQVGSIFKPILYATAINKFNYDPCTKISNDRFKLGNWAPRNYNNKYGGTLTLKDSLALSTNIISARLISKITAKPVINMAKKMGIKSFIPNNPSIAIGSADLTLYEMTGAFNVFTNYGIYVKPKILLRIEDKYGNVIKNNTSVKKTKVFNKKTSNMMLNLMRGVVKYGTANSLITKYKMKGDIVGKTGTTNDNSDGWFIGMTPNLTTGIWVGWEDRYTHFEDNNIGQGSQMALPIWSYYMKSLYSNPSKKYNNLSFNIDNNWNCIDNINNRKLFKKNDITNKETINNISKNNDEIIKINNDKKLSELEKNNETNEVFNDDKEYDKEYIISNEKEIKSKEKNNNKIENK